MRGRTTLTLAAFLIGCMVHGAYSLPQPGDVYRDIVMHVQVQPLEWCNYWCEVLNSSGTFVSGQTFPSRFPADKVGAIRLEVGFEGTQENNETRGFQVRLNGNAWVTLPEYGSIPSPQYQYTQHNVRWAQVPLSHLQAGVGNTFSLRHDGKLSKRTPPEPRESFLSYALIVRVYYDPSTKPHPGGSVTSPLPDALIGESVVLAAEARPTPAARIVSVDYVGNYEDVDYNGDGAYRGWQYMLHKGIMSHNLGSVRYPLISAPYEVTWSTLWVPDQSAAVQVAALIKESTGLVYMTEAVGGLSLVRPGLSVKLCKPYNVPKDWCGYVIDHNNTTRSERFNVEQRTGITNAQLAGLVWSGPEWAGFRINGRDLYQDSMRTGYVDAAFQRIDLKPVTALQQGVNTLEVLTSAANHFGGVICWPGIQVLLQYRSTGIEGRSSIGPTRSPFSAETVTYCAGRRTLSIMAEQGVSYRFEIVGSDGRSVMSGDGNGEAQYRLGTGQFAPGLHLIRIVFPHTTVYRTLVLR